MHTNIPHAIIMPTLNVTCEPRRKLSTRIDMAILSGTFTIAIIGYIALAIMDMFS